MTVPDLALLLLRVTIGLTFAAHGAQKAFGWWGGPGPDGWTNTVRGMGFRPHRIFAGLAIGAELLGGLALAAGLLTPLAAAVLVAQSVVIIFRAHLEQGFFARDGGFEFPLALGAAALAVGLLTAGAISLDAWLGMEAEPAMRVLLILGGLAAGGIVVSISTLRDASLQGQKRDRLERR